MALAILELLAFDGANVRFRIDTGTNKYYQLKAGKSVERNNGIDWVDEIFLKTRMATNDAGRGLFNSSKEIAVPATRLGAGHAYVQLFSFKTPDGKSPAFSRVLKVPVASARYDDDGEYEGPMSMSFSTSMNTLESFQAPRVVPCRTCRDVYSQQASLDQLLAGIVKVATPVVMNLLGGATAAAANGGAGATANNAGQPAGQANTLINLLTTLLGSIGGAPAAATNTPAAVSTPQSLGDRRAPGNRFADSPPMFAQPFVFGIDDALIGAAIGQVVQVLPQLMTAANQKRIEMKKANNQLITSIVSDINRRLLTERLLEAQRQPPAAGQPDNSAAIQQVLQLLQQAEAAPNGTTTATPPPATAQSFSFSETNGVVGDDALLSSKAVLELVGSDPIAWNGGTKKLFARGQDLQLKLQVKTANPPKSTIPKAIVKIILQDAADQSIRFEKVFKQKDISANAPLSFAFSQAELVHLPANKNISVLAEMRWRTRNGAEYKALGSGEIALVNKYFFKEQGAEAGVEQELTDMKRFRPFWNKVWESPTLDASRGGEKKYLWELKINAKYTVLLSATHDANGLMQTKLLRGKPDPESMSETIDGRMKAGIELSIPELNKLLPLWNGQAALDPQKLEALQTVDFAKNNSGELLYNLKLKGRAAERGMIWIIPTFKLFECTLGTVAKTDEAGQVVATSEEKVHFPLPVSARVIGLKSKT
jgi:hypothetical protein